MTSSEGLGSLGPRENCWTHGITPFSPISARSTWTGTGTDTDRGEGGMIRGMERMKD